jgi:transcriptional regulator with XRE-family HTH domain
MATRETRLQRGRQRGHVMVTDALKVLRDGRVHLGISQETMASALGCSQTGYAKFEAGQVPVTVQRLAEAAAVLGLKASLGFYPEGDAIRDAGQQALVKRFRAVVVEPWRVVGQEGAMPISGDGRAWDVELQLRTAAARQDVGVECETRIRDIQALARRTHLRERDSGVDRQLIVLSDSAHNRHLADELRDALGDAYRRSPRLILGELRAGRLLSGSGVILV